MSEQLERRRREVVVPVRVDPAGQRGPTRNEAVGPHWRRTSRGHYVPVDVDRSVPEQRIVEAAAVLPAYGGVTGWAALRWCGARWFDGLAQGGRVERPVTLATSCSDVRSQTGIVVSAEGLAPDELSVVDGLRVTAPERSLCFEMRYAAGPRHAVVAADMAAYSDVVSLE